MQNRYRKGDAPSVFDEHPSDLGRIEPIQLLMAWRRLGSDAELDQKRYLLDLFQRRPGDLNWFLHCMFRVEFLDDYKSLEPLINYDDLAQLIERNLSVLDSDKVKQFKTRYEAERASQQRIA